MQVKIFEAPDMATGLRQVRKELGPDALILSTRTVKGGKLGLLGKKYLEITAAVDHKWDDKKNTNKNAAQKSQAAMAYESNQQHKETVLPEKQTIEGIDDKNIAKEFNDLTFTIEPKSKKPEKKEALPEEFYELKDMVQNLAGQLSQIGNNDKDTVVQRDSRIVSRLEEKLRAGSGNSHVEEILLANEVNRETASILSTYVDEKLSHSDPSDVAALYTILHETIADILTVESISFTNDTQQRRIALIGPTGVGKTTTIAKIAAKYLSEKSNSIAFITVDTYRIAAVEQLKVYGEIMHLPVEVVITPQQLQEALAKHQDKELILIDTAGRSPMDTLSIDEICSFFKPELNIENHLVLSATTRENELLETLQRFSRLQIKSTIFTKIDECIHLGVLLNVQAHTNSPLSFLTNGQRVPEDIIEADNNHLAQLIIPPLMDS